MVPEANADLMTSEKPPANEQGAEDPLTQCLRHLKKEFTENPWPWLSGVFIGCVSTALAAWAFASDIARKAVLNEKFLGELATKVRPTSVFNTKQTIEYDAATADYVSEIHVVPVPDKYGYEITVVAKRHLAYPPLVNSIDANLYPTKINRGEKHTWKYLMIPNPNTGTFLSSEQMDTNAVFRFKLEILH